MASCLSTGNISSFRLIISMIYYIFTKNILAKICETGGVGKGFNWAIVWWRRRRWRRRWWWGRWFHCWSSLGWAATSQACSESASISLFPTRLTTQIVIFVVIVVLLLIIWSDFFLLPKIFSPTLIIIRPLCLYLYWWQIFFDEDVFVFLMNESDSGDDAGGRVWLWGISELQCLSLFTQISIFNVYIDFCFFRCLHHHLFFLMFTPFSVFSMLYRPLLFSMFCINICFLMFTPISFFFNVYISTSVFFNVCINNCF